MMNPDPAPEFYTTRYKYRVIFILAFVYMFSTIDRTLISVLAEPIKVEFGLSDSQLGILTGLIFAISYSLAGIPVGFLVDRYRRTRLLAALVAIWSSLTFLSGLAGSWITLALARFGVAASEAGAPPAAMSLITDYFPKEERGTALSLFYMSTPIGFMLSFAIGGILADMFGWRAAFFIAGIPGLLLGLLILLAIREPRRGNFDPPLPSESLAPRPKMREVAATLIRVRPLLFLLLGAVSIVTAQAGLTAFLAPFLMRVHDLSIEQAGYALALATGPTGVIGIVAGGILADRLARRSPSAAPRAVGYLIMLAAPIAIAGLLMDDWRIAILLFAAYNLLNYLYYGATFSTYMTLAPVRMRGALSAILMVSMTLVGYGIGPPLAGFASDLIGAAGVADPLRWALMIIALFFALAGPLFFAAAAAIRRMNETLDSSSPITV